MEEQNRDSVFVWIVTGVLMLFTAFRSVDLIQSTLPASARVLAFAALAGLDGGVLAWLFWANNAAHAGAQRTIASMMIIVDLVGMAAAVLADTMMIVDSGNRDLVGTVAVWVIPAVVMANVAAGVVVHHFDPIKAAQRARRDAEYAITDELEKQKNEWLKANAPTIAAQAAQAAGEHMAQQMLARFKARHEELPTNAALPTNLPTIMDEIGGQPVPQFQPVQRGNGHKGKQVMEAASPLPDVEKVVRQSPKGKTR